MPREGWKSLNLTEEEYEKIRKIAKKKRMTIKAVVIDSLEDKYPEEFPKEE